MIVISGALVLVALVLLIIGVVGPDLTFVYASIAVSLVSLVFLVVGILQRRGETAPAADAASTPPQVTPADASDVTAVVPSQEARASMRKVVQEPPAAASAADEPATGGTVLVVEGRPRYHVEGCRYLSGKSAEAVDVLDAREEGFSPCGVCKPDDALAAAAEAEPVEEQLPEGAATAEPVVEEDVPGVPVAPARTRAATRKAPAKKAAVKAAPAVATKAVKAPAAKAPGRAAAKAAPVAAVKAPASAAVKAPAKAAAAAAPARAGSVVVIPDRGRFHKAQCRFVRDVDGTEVMSKSAASRAGYAACGVCKP